MSKIFVTSLEEGIFQLTIDDPENQNRATHELFQELTNALTDLAKEPTIKVLIIKGRKDVFFAGGTVDVIKEVASSNIDVKDFFLPHQVLSFPVPVIGALEGHAVGGGLFLALCCDILIASESSRYGVHCTNMGFTPGMGTTSLLPALVGYSFASEMILTGKSYKGRELRDKNLFNYVVKSEEVMDIALDIASRIAEKPRVVIEMLKETLSLPRRQLLQQAISREHLMHKICFSKPEIAAQVELTYLK
ncbi:enoyl-CoA hydratase/isomerase family protein [Nostoc sp. CENA67]|uniref:Enoyl-CoA hydratase/isomerase family protein n=1 Tax=Amazonocrinis nigriterrae CENA67 TaxID=2794033 RepID=A0A8J7HLF8_9NOST|nr:polyketide synthase [Amazonocrinis nigriterrae]MBH8561402.1 enoyl-CoA hydratase/isomerase family protein [Amazonocrinis nigriterrae CENA67]